MWREPAERRRGAKGLVSGCGSERFPCGGGLPNGSGAWGLQRIQRSPVGGDNVPESIVEEWAVRACLGSSFACEIIDRRRINNVANRPGSSCLHFRISIFPS